MSGSWPNPKTRPSGVKGKTTVTSTTTPTTVSTTSTLPASVLIGTTTLKLKDQLQRALLGAYLQFTEGAAREGNDRNSRLRTSRAEAAEAAAALEAAVALKLTAEGPAEHVIAPLDRFSAMVTGLGKLNK